MFRDVPTAYISDSMAHLRGVVGLRKYHRAGVLLGTAFTVKTRPGDNLMVHKALDLARPGDVLVVDGGGDVSNALAGELMMLFAQRKRLAGFVVDGAIRDVAVYQSSNFPCYARAHTHKGPYRDGPGEINVPVTVGGLVIQPGDAVVGDEDGVVAFPSQEAHHLIEMTRRLAEVERQSKVAIADGTFEKSWVDDVLRAKGIPLNPS